MLFKAENVNKSYGDKVVLNNINLGVPEGIIFGLLGPNGAGKTTFIRIINQITKPDSGIVYINGEPLSQRHISEIGYLPEERGLYKKMKIGEQALYLAQLKGMSKTEAKNALKYWFEKFDIGDWYDKKVEELSKGMAQKVQFITTIMHKPKVLILDEPFSGFDPINAELIRKEILSLRAEGSTIFLSTHNMDSVEEICQRIALLNHGRKVLDGGVGDLRKQYKKDIYELHHTGVFNKTDQFDLIEENTDDDGSIFTTIKLKDGVNINSVLLTGINNGTQILGLREVIPSMRDIFIEAVNTQLDN